MLGILGDFQVAHNCFRLSPGNPNVRWSVNCHLRCRYLIGSLQDRRPLRVQELIEPAPPPPEEDAQVDIAPPEPMAMGDQTASPKVVQLIELLKMQPWDSKSLVFSQFTSFLDKVSNKIRFTIQFAEPHC